MSEHPSADTTGNRARRYAIALFGGGQSVPGVRRLVDKVRPFMAAGNGPSRVVYLDYPVDPAPRYGYGHPPNEPVRALLATNIDQYGKRLEAFLADAAWMDAVPMDAPSIEGMPYWLNPYMPAPDAFAICAFLLAGSARRYIEVGSGESTKFARHCIEQRSLPTHITSIDPEPRDTIDRLADSVVRLPLEQADLDIFDDLEEGDVVFIDNSHRVLPNSDATVVFLDILPRLKPGIVVGFHDVFLPCDYPLEWRDRFYSEQYCLASYLLGGNRLEVLLPVQYMLRDRSQSAPLDGFLDSIEARYGKTMPAGSRNGVSFWVRT